jgi:hypothetical protein
MAPWNRRKRRPPHRFAAHQVAVPVVEASIKQLSAKLDDWQRRVLNYAAIVPEVMTGYSYVENTMDMVTLELQRFDRTLNDWVADDSPEINAIERRINTAFKMGRAAALGHLVEECYVLVSRKKDEDGGTSYSFDTLAPTEIKSKAKVVEKRVLKDGETEEWIKVPEAETIIRIYNEDPSDRFKASGPHKALLGVLETMALELSRDQADAISVLAGNGILYIPTEVLPDEVDTLDASDTPGSRRAFESALEDAMVATIADRQRGDAIVPITLYGPAEHAQSIRHILPSRESAYESNARMADLILRYARDIDLPMQVILGSGEANHWGDWKVDENTWAYHLRPRGQRIADAIYTGLVRSVIRNLGKNPDVYRMVPNPSAAMAKADITGAIGDAYERGVVKPETYIQALDLQQSDMREDAEELLLVLRGRGAEQQDALAQVMPDRAAASSPTVLLRQAGRAANVHQRKLEAIFRRYLTRIADDAARDGKAQERARDDAQKAAAAAALTFEGYEASRYFAKYADEMAQATQAELFAYLKRIATLTGQDYNALRKVWVNEFSARAAAIVKEAESAAAKVSTSSFGSGRPTRITEANIRTLTSIANGGANAGNGAAGNTTRPTHAGEDPLTKDVLTDAGLRYITEYTWVVGEPQRPFHPHQELEGMTWQSWQEFDALEVPSDDSWLPGTVFFPGDHDGCQCEYSIDFIPAEETSE